MKKATPSRTATPPSTKPPTRNTKAATLDGEDQWTCTAAASSEVPARDSCIAARTIRSSSTTSPPNIPGRQELFEQLKLFMAELRAS
ncbi:MAG: hypothetical protein ACLRWP_13170 [Bilophila wadsworthia]